MYFRKSVEGDETAAAEKEKEIAPAAKETVTVQGETKAPRSETDSDREKTQAEAQTYEAVAGEVTRKKRSYWDSLALFVKMEGRPSNQAMFTMMWRPLLIMYYFPSVSWAGFLYGTCLSWYNVLNATASAVLSAAPYNFSSGLVGTAYLSPVIAAGLGALWSGWSADKWALWLARRNGGIREAEHRLWPLAFSGIMCSAGLILWGVGAARGVHWFGPIVGLGLLAFSVVCGGSIALSYDVDCFKVCSLNPHDSLPSLSATEKESLTRYSSLTLLQGNRRRIHDIRHHHPQHVGVRRLVGHQPVDRQLGPTKLLHFRVHGRACLYGDLFAHDQVWKAAQALVDQEVLGVRCDKYCAALKACNCGWN